jgi:hypothetical protein
MVLRVLWEDFKLKSDASLQKVYTLSIRPRRVSVNINDYTSADTFSVEIDYKHFPFDPRCIRSLGVTIFGQDMKSLYGDDGRITEITPSRANTLFQGFADEETIELSSDSRKISFEGRDFTAILIDAPFGHGKVDITRPLDVIITEFLSELKATAKLTVENRTGETLPIIGKFAPDYSPLAAGKNVDRKDKYWEVIQDLVGRAGLIAFIEIDKLVISKPRNVYGRKSNYEFIYGQNLKSLQYKRKLGRQKDFNIQIKSLNLETKEVLVAKVPEEATEQWCKAVGIAREAIKIEKIGPNGEKMAAEAAPYIGFVVPDIASKDQLIKIAEKTFEEVGRQQIEGSLETKEMVILQGAEENPVEFDVTKIRNGTPVKVEIEQGDMDGLRRIKSAAEKEQFLIARGYEPSVAAALAKSLGKFDTVFYTKAVEFSFDAEDGFQMKLDFVNFIELTGKGLGK